MSTSDDLRSIALTEFATVGYAGTSLQRIAELGGLSKSSVLYHYASKEALLEAAIGPAIDRMRAILEHYAEGGLTPEGRREFLSDFVDFLLDYRLEVNTFINQGPSLTGVPVIDRATGLVAQIADFFAVNSESLEEKMRFGIALGGAAYMLCTVQNLGRPLDSDEEMRTALVTILGDLLSPAAHSVTAI